VVVASVPDRGKEILMLQVTDAAVSVFKRALLHEGESPAPETTVRAVRIQPGATQDGQQAITFQAVEGPEAGDAASEASDLDVFVAPELAAPLESAVLDARETPQGAQVFLRDQAEPG
jgi:Fe-S cluster assembly iron-binding protein IscA